jgi:hypothetical protein
MKKLFVIPAFISLLFSMMYGDDPERINTPLILLPQGYVINSGLGFVNYTNSTVTAISTTNPASMEDFNKISGGISFLFTTQIDPALGNIEGIEHSRVNPLLPQAFGLVLPYLNFQFGLGFNQKYSGSVDVGPIPVTTANEPGGTGETYNAVFDRYVYSGSAMFSYLLPNFINDDHHFSMGLQIDVNFLRDYENLGRISAEATDQSVTWKGGVRYSFLDLLQLGAAFEKGANFEGKLEYKGDELLIPDSGFVSRQIENIVTAKLPDRLLMGLAFKIGDNIRLANDFTYIYWEKLYSEEQNQLDISGNLYFLPSQGLSLSAGFYSTRRESIFPDSPDENAFFISAGALIKVKSAAIEIMLADSHLFSSDTRKQTLARLGVDFSF